MTKEHKRNLRLSHLGKKFTAEHRKNISLVRLGKKLSPEHKKALAKSIGDSCFDRMLRKFYNGFTEVEYNEMSFKQSGTCRICCEHETAKIKGTIKRLSVDHDHKTGKVRGLLCNRCNHILGLLKDNAYIARRITQYLEEVR